MTELWDLVAAERGALADDLSDLTSEQWATPSLCAGWSVRDVLAHLTATASLNPPRFFASFVKAGFSFDRFVNTEIGRHLGADPAATLAGFRAIQQSRTAPPGPKPSWLGEVIVHAEDIRRPLGITHAYDPAALVAVADFYKGSNTLIGTKSRIAGLALAATDVDFRHGTGAEVTGPMLPLLMAMTGRSAACAELSGPGVDRLRAGGR